MIVISHKITLMMAFWWNNGFFSILSTSLIRVLQSNSNKLTQISRSKVSIPKQGVSHLLTKKISVWGSLWHTCLLKPHSNSDQWDVAEKNRSAGSRIWCRVYSERGSFITNTLPYKPKICLLLIAKFCPKHVLMKLLLLYKWVNAQVAHIVLQS